MTEPSPDGVLAVDKPAGPTSHDIVAAVRRALRTRRVGHTGTLDPFASGLLLICIGSATRIAEYLTGLDKRYTAAVRLGVRTDTDDHTGTVLSDVSAAHIDRAAVERALRGMTGTILQRPPAYSAKKVAGERAYAAARAGRALDLEPVPVRIHELHVTGFEPPMVELDIACGSGTYIRSIARDLGDALGVGAHLAALRRTQVGDATVDDAIALADLDDPARVGAALLPAAAALAGMPRLELSDEQLGHIRHGRAVRVGAAALPPDGTVVALLHGGALVAIGAVAGDLVRPRKVLA